MKSELFVPPLWPWMASTLTPATSFVLSTVNVSGRCALVVPGAGALYAGGVPVMFVLRASFLPVQVGDECVVVSRSVSFSP